MSQLQAPSIEEAITILYEESEAHQPRMGRLIVPLRQLVTGCNLLRVELADLTRQSAINYLSQSAPEIEFFTDADREPLSGFLYASPRSGTVFIKRSDPVARRRFTMAHEVGHYLLHLCPLFNYLAEQGRETLIEISEHTPTEVIEDDADEDGVCRSALLAEDDTAELLPPLEVMEQEADEFATNLLMPGDLVRELAESYTGSLRDTDLVWRLAAEMLVSTSAMSRRLSELRLIETREGIFH